MQKRDLRIDTIRGLLLVIMAVNHTHSALIYEGWIKRLTEAPLGYVTGAEGFIFISGFVMGLVYVKYQRVQMLFRKATSRGISIYLHHLLPLYSLHILAFFVPFLAIAWERDLSFYYLAKRTLIAEALLLYQPEVFDILPMYVIFVMVAPFVFLALKKKWGWIFVLAFSFSLWILGQQVDLLCNLNMVFFPGHRCGWFNILVWQVLFVLGIILGFYKSSIEEIKYFKNPLFVICIFAVAFLLFSLRHRIIDLSFWEAAIVIKKNLGWLRIVNLMVLVAFFGILFTKLPKRVHLPAIAFLGQHSLQVFTFHVLLIYFITPFQSAIVANFNRLTYPIFMLLVIASLLIPAYLHDVWQRWKKTT